MSSCLNDVAAEGVVLRSGVSGDSASPKSTLCAYALCRSGVSAVANGSTRTGEKKSLPSSCSGEGILKEEDGDTEAEFGSGNRSLRGLAIALKGGAALSAPSGEALRAERRDFWPLGCCCWPKILLRYLSERSHLRASLLDGAADLPALPGNPLRPMVPVRLGDRDEGAKDMLGRLPLAVSVSAFGRDGHSSSLLGAANAVLVAFEWATSLCSSSSSVAKSLLWVAAGAEERVEVLVWFASSPSEEQSTVVAAEASCLPSSVCSPSSSDEEQAVAGCESLEATAGVWTFCIGSLAAAGEPNSAR